MAVLVDWLRTLGLERYASVFEENEVDFATLQILTDEDLQELGIPFGPRKKILSALTRVVGSLPSLEPPAGAPPEAASAASPEGAPTGERRQLTVLFCDLVGFTEMAGRLDPEVLQTVLRRYEDACAGCVVRYEGYVFQRVGDGIVAFFGYPLAHEAEAERAVRAGLEMLSAMETLEVPEVGRLRVRIGVASGLVVVSSVERSAVGETMNLAARLQTLAEPDTLVVSERVHRIAGGAFDYVDLGSHDLKGIRKATHAYRVLGVRKSVSRFDAATHEGLTPFVGREDEMRVLAERWEEARRGSGRAIEVSGEPGIGKSRIVSAFRVDLESQGTASLRFQCSPYHVHSAFYPSIAHLEAALEFGPGEAPEARLDRLEAYVVSKLGLPAGDVRFLAALLSLPWKDRYDPLTLSPRDMKEQTIRVLVDLMEAAARNGPALVVVEDLHWADPTTLEVMDQLVARLPGLPILAVMTYRPEFNPRWLDYDFVTPLSLGRLGREESLALVNRVTGGKALPGDLLDSILERTDGIPLYVEELTKSILESPSLRLEGDSYAYAASDKEVHIPATLRDSLMARLDRVPDVKEVAQIGAAIGREFSYELLAALADLEEAVLHERLARLADSGLVFQWGAIPDAMYSFKHALVQDAAYDSMLKSRRQRLHGRIAGVMEERFPDTRVAAPELLARHYSAAGRHEVATPHWRRAGELALERFAIREATAHLREGLHSISERAPGPERDRDGLELRTRLSPAMVAVHGWAAPEVVGVLEPALEAARSLDHRESYLPILTGLWIHFMSAGKHSTAMEWAEETLAIAADTGDEDLEICGHRSAMTSNFWMGDLRASQEHGDRLKELYHPERHAHIARLTNNDPLTADGSYRAQYLWMMGYPDQAVALSDTKDEHARQRGHPFDLCFALTVGAQVFDYRREPEALLQRVEEAIRVGREHRIPLMSEVMAQLVKGAAWLRAGRHADAVEALHSPLVELGKTGHRAWVPYVRANLAEAAARTGDLEAGLALIEESLEQIDRQGERVHLAEVLRLKGWMLIEKGDHEAAEQALREAVRFSREQGTRSWELRASTTLAGLLARRGDKRAARELLAPIYDWFTEGLDTADLVDARALLAGLT